MISAILAAISQALGLVNHLWESYNRSDMVKAKVAQMSQNERDKHAELIEKAMKSGKEHEQALEELRKLTSE